MNTRKIVEILTDEHFLNICVCSAQAGELQLYWGFSAAHERSSRLRRRQGKFNRTNIFPVLRIPNPDCIWILLGLWILTWIRDPDSIKKGLKEN